MRYFEQCIRLRCVSVSAAARFSGDGSDLGEGTKRKIPLITARFITQSWENRSDVWASAEGVLI
jgi:hypothetical protein